MQFRLVLTGAVLLAIGLLAYSAIPNIHRTALLKTQPVLALSNVTVPYGAYEIVRDISVQGTSDELRANITLIAQQGDLSPLRFQLFPKNASASCASTQPKPVSFLVNQDVTNQSITVPIGTSGAYCFVFDNETSSPVKTKTVSTSVELYSTTERITTSNDGGVNMAGVGLGAFGFVVLLYGSLRKAVIPWE